MSEEWIADRMHLIDASGIRKVFDLAANMKNPINLSIGQPHFDTPEPIKEALCQAVKDGKNAYSQTQGIAPLIEKFNPRSMPPITTMIDRSLFQRYQWRLDAGIECTHQSR